MFKTIKYELMLYLLILVSIPTVSGVCFSGGTGSCQFTCHCRDDVACYAATGECPTGQCARIGESFYYTGNSCQIGHVAYGADATQTGSEDEHTADRAVDGDILAFLTDGSCAAAVRETGRGLYWQVDLGGQYVISYVQIFREANNRHTVSGVKLYVSDSSTAPSDATDLCGTQSGSSNRIECGSPKVGRYVRIEQADDDIDEMWICETQVQGYRYHECGWYDGDYRYGPTCVSRCHCSEQCDVVTGVCRGECMVGWRYSSDRVCSNMCEAGTWGEGCAQQCNCQSVCDRINGLCTAGCTVGYRGNTCQEACEPGTWGYGCTNDCNCQATCNRANGECLGDCIPGYHGPACSAICDDGDWGLNCANQCSEYCVDPVCDKANGYCSSDSCVDGYIGDTCTQPCDDGHYGNQCVYTCNCRENSEVCNKRDGSCPGSGCHDWYVGVNCQHELPKFESTDGLLLYAVDGNNITLQFHRNISELYLVQYRTVEAEIWVNVTLTQPKGNVSYKITVILPYNIECDVRLVPWDSTYNLPGKPGNATHVVTMCDNGFWGQWCNHTCRCNNVSEACDKVSGACVMSGCDVQYLGVDGGCRPTVLFEDVDIEVDNIQDLLKIQLLDAVIQENITGYNIEYKPKYIKDTSWQREVPSVAAGSRYRRSNSKLLELTIDWKPHHINTLYNFRIVSLYTIDDTTSEGIPSDIFTYTQGCMSSRDVTTSSSWSVPYTQLCSDWCTCRSSDGISHWCLLTCVYCGMCDEQPLLPSSQDTHIHVQLITDTTVTVNITTSYNNELLGIVAYMVYYNDNDVELEFKGKTHIYEATNLASGTLYNIQVYPVVMYNSNTFTSYPITANATTSGVKSNTNFPIIYIIIICAVIALLLVIAFVLIICIISRSRNRDNSQEAEGTSIYQYIKIKLAPHRNRSQQSIPRDALYDTTKASTAEYAEPTRQRNIVAVVPIKVKTLDELKKKQSSVNKLNTEYQTKVMNNPNATTVESEKDCNKAKNRYNVNINVYDHSRVELSMQKKDPSSTYINASYLDGYLVDREFIAAQGPKKETVDDFWRMIWEKNVSIIVMITKLVEDEKEKCACYWPNNSSRYGDVEVERLSETQYAFQTEYQFKLSCSDISRELFIMQFTDWPDKTAPRGAGAFLEFYSRVESLSDKNDGPVVVHCSAGVGRTGTFIAIDYLMKQAESEELVDVPACVNLLRRDRPEMVQNAEQYRFIYRALYEALLLGKTTLPYNEYESLFTDMTASTKTKKSAMEKQYININKLLPLTVEESDDLNQHADQVHDMSVVSANDKMVYLSSINGHDTFINAVSCDSYRQKNSIIMTQMAMRSTTAEVWRLVDEHTVAGIIVLGKINPESGHAQYWPEAVGESEEFGQYTITHKKAKALPNTDVSYRYLEYTVESERKRRVPQWQLPEVEDEESFLDNASAVLATIDHMRNAYHRGTIMVQCHNGVDVCGMFVVLFCVMEKIQCSRLVDVAFAVKQIRQSRQMAIRTLAQYDAIHRALMETKADDDAEYSNAMSGKQDLIL